MSSTAEPHKEHHCGGGEHGPPSEEQRQKWHSEFKQSFLDQYHKVHGDAQISAEQTWELYSAVNEQWLAKRKEHHHEHHHQHQTHSPSDHSSPPPQHGPAPGQMDETHKRINNELHQEFLNDFKTTHAATDKVDAEHAWLLIEKVQHSKHEKWEADRAQHSHKHGPKHHGHGHEHDTPPHDH